MTRGKNGGEHSMHSSVILSGEINPKIPGMPKPNSSREIAKEEKVELIFRLPTSAAKFGDVDRESTCSHSSGKRLP